jgi:GTP pyrophosphokinase
LTSHTKRTRQWTDRETISKKWAKELESDELQGQKKISVKIETHKALRDVAKTNESYDDIIGRLITFYKKYEYRYVLADIKPISTLVERYFRIDRKKSVDKATKLGKSKVGIRSKHYIAELLGEQLESIKGYPDSSKFEGLFFEIQVKTLLDYARSEIEHDRNYKTAIEFRKPSYIQRRFMLVAGLLEVADNEFEQLSTETQKYAKPIPSRILNAT